MLLLKTANKQRDILNREVPYVAMFQYTTVHSLSEYLGSVGRESSGSGEPDKYDEQAETIDRSKNRMKKIIKRGREAN